MTLVGSKIFVGIVNQIRSIIQDDGLVTGDKIPSERELSERLKVGRSSVREALRSLELLGLIETRRGEGTYLKDFSEHQFLHVIGTFILQGEKTRNDLLETKYLVERSCIELVCNRISNNDLQKWKENLSNSDLNEEGLYRTIIEATNNRLLLRIWLILNEYTKVFHNEHANANLDYMELISGLVDQNVARALQAHQKLACKEFVD